MPRWLLARMRDFALAVETIALGLAVHRRGSALSPVVRDVLGDALWWRWWCGGWLRSRRQSGCRGVRRWHSYSASPSNSASCSVCQRSTRSAGRLRDTLCSEPDLTPAILSRTPPGYLRQCSSKEPPNAVAPTSASVWVREQSANSRCRRHRCCANIQLGPARTEFADSPLGEGRPAGYDGTRYDKQPR